MGCRAFDGLAIELNRMLAGCWGKMLPILHDKNMSQEDAANDMFLSGMLLGCWWWDVALCHWML